MIHYSIAYTGARDTSAHGTIFRSMMDNLNRKYGWEITVSSHTAGWKVRIGQKQTERIVLAIRTSAGKCFLSVVNPKFSASLERKIRFVKEITWHGWYISGNDFFADMPAVRSLRFRKVPQDEFVKILAEKCPATIWTSDARLPDLPYQKKQ